MWKTKNTNMAETQLKPVIYTKITKRQLGKQAGHLEKENRQLKGIVQRIITGVKTRLKQSLLLNWRPDSLYI